ncbi:MAG: FAD-binding oxidoreductase [Deltaproteobacteria bacterium]|nr:FAD-binding oxidoreductase [Deltaproteobacteria bacterium]
MNKNSLKKIFPDDRISFRAEDLMAVSTDASGIYGPCYGVVWPEGEKELQRLVLWARDQRTAVDLVPRGAGTGLAGGAVPRGSLVVDLSRMTRVLEVNPSDETIRVQGGCVLDTLNQHLSRSHLHLPVIPGSHAACTVGGMAATNAAGFRAIHFGRMEDYVIDALVVDGNAQIRTLHGESTQQWIGSEGTLGIILEVTLRVRPRENSSTTQKIKLPSIEDVCAFIPEIRQIEGLVALELLDPACSAAMGWEDKYHLLVERAASSEKDMDKTEALKTWKARSGLYAVLASHGLHIIEDPFVPFEGLASALGWLKEHRIPVFGHMGVGILHPCFEPGQEQRVDDLMRVIMEIGGKPAGEHGVGVRKREYLSLKELTAHRLRKDRYDPHRIFNRDKIWKESAA